MEHINNFTLYKLGSFKTENIIESFEERGLYLNEKIDLMASQWTLKHLVDSLGTFLQMLQLTKTKGYMLLEGIPFVRLDQNGDRIYEKSYSSISDRNLNAGHLLQDLKQPHLMCPTNKNLENGLRDIMIQKSKVDESLVIDLSYHNSLLADYNNGYTQFVTKKSSRLESEFGTVEYKAFDGDINLYNMLKERDLFFKYNCYYFCHLMNSHYGNLDFVEEFATFSDQNPYEEF